MIVDADEVVAWAELFKDETFTAEQVKQPGKEENK